jgi:hypothetical protein
VRRFLITAFILAAAGAAQAQAVSEPVDSHPTVGSESRRGWDDGGECDLTLGPLDFTTCLAGVSAREGVKIGDNRAFNLGLSLFKWLSQDAMMAADLRRTGDPIASQQAPAAAEQANTAFGEVRDLQKAIGLTDEDVIGMPTMSERHVRDRWAYYLQQAPSR